MRTPPFSPHRLRVADSFPHKGRSTTLISFLPPLRGKVSGVAHRAKPDGRVVPATASCAALPPLASKTLAPYQVIAFARAHEAPLGGGGMDCAGNNYIAETAITPWKQKERRND